MKSKFSNNTENKNNRKQTKLSDILFYHNPFSLHTVNT